jgi:hypothetical protein
MTRFFFIQSREPFTDSRANGDYELIHNLACAGNEVTVMLVQNGVMPARRGSMINSFDKLCDGQARLLADPFSLTQRQIGTNDLKGGIEPVALDATVKALLAGHTVIWH